MEEKSPNKADQRVLEWEVGLPSPEDLTSLSQSLITPELCYAFGITTSDPHRSPFAVNRAPYHTFRTIFRRDDASFEFEPLKLFPDKNESDSCKMRKIETEANSRLNAVENGQTRAVKRPRLVWTPQLHKRFVDVIEHLGIDKAVPKTIMEMMNVEGLSRENVASHLQKYRLYLKRVEGLPSVERRSNSLSPKGAPKSDVQMQHSLHCGSLPFFPLPMVETTDENSCGYGRFGVNVGNSAAAGYSGLESGASCMFWNRRHG
ncbi:hypothetical protein Nepgr_017201 [Nepenthes gracilis]|uniref:Myb-like domain-containing protein n=1 Tax=Nepenthes gracilis TaxID=150966 RepID=A0AAD3XT64_NEPGR|nr:hypothetical protein Nepgr_017201 [Nepenthes gracilis]